LLKALFATIKHFFGGVNELFSEVNDPRISRKITYPLPALAFVGMLMFLCHLGARRQIRLRLHTPSSAVTFNMVFGVNIIPHGDTLNDAFKQCDPEDFQRVVCRMGQTLIRKKVNSFKISTAPTAESFEIRRRKFQTS
jgi:hypothetical protein